MNENRKILAVSNSYIKKYYIDDSLIMLPAEIKNELKIMLVTLTEDIGGIVEMVYDDEIVLVSYSDKNDFSYDEIDAKLKTRNLENEKKDFFTNLSTYYKFKNSGILDKIKIK